MPLSLRGCGRRSPGPCQPWTSRKKLRLPVPVRRRRLRKVDDAFFRSLLLLLDGEHSILDVKKALRKKIGAGEFSEIGEKSALLRDLPVMVKDNLREIAGLGLLSA